MNANHLLNTDTQLYSYIFLPNYTPNCLVSKVKFWKINFFRDSFSDFLSTGQANSFRDVVEFVQRVEFDNYPASLPIFSGLNVYLCGELAAEFPFQVQDVGRLRANGCLGLTGAGKIPSYQSFNFAHTQPTYQCPIG